MKWLLCSLALALTGCGSGSSSMPLCGAEPLALQAPPTLVTPPAGATGVQTNGLDVGISYDPAGDGTLRLVAADGSTVTGGPFGEPVSPNPPSEVLSALPPLAARTAYTVFVDAVYPPAGRCPPPGPSGPTTFDLGAFTTT